MKKYFRTGIHCVQLDYQNNSVIIVSSKGNDFAMKVIHNNPKEVKEAENQINKKENAFKESITEKQFMNELRTVLMMSETKAMQLQYENLY